MSKIILINGKKRSGKDYTAKMMKRELENSGFSVAVMSFADPIKEIIATTFGISLELLDKLKNQKQEIYTTRDDATDEEIYIGDDLQLVSNFRTILQRFGTEAMQEMFGKTVWVDLLQKKADNSDCDFVIVPDFRFLQENIGDITIHIFNNAIIDSIDLHASENELNDFKFNYEIDNTEKPDISYDIQSICRVIIMDFTEFLIP